MVSKQVIAIGSLVLVGGVSASIFSKSLFYVLLALFFAAYLFLFTTPTEITPNLPVPGKGIESVTWLELPMQTPGAGVLSFFTNLQSDLLIWLSSSFSTRVPAYVLRLDNEGQTTLNTWDPTSKTLTVVLTADTNFPLSGGGSTPPLPLVQVAFAPSSITLFGMTERMVEKGLISSTSTFIGLNNFGTFILQQLFPKPQEILVPCISTVGFSSTAALEPGSILSATWLSNTALTSAVGMEAKSGTDAGDMMWFDENWTFPKANLGRIELAFQPPPEESISSDTQAGGILVVASSSPEWNPERGNMVVFRLFSQHEWCPGGCTAGTAKYCLGPGAGAPELQITVVHDQSSDTQCDLWIRNFLTDSSAATTTPSPPCLRNNFNLNKSQCRKCEVFDSAMTGSQCGDCTTSRHCVQGDSDQYCSCYKCSGLCNSNFLDNVFAPLIGLDVVPLYCEIVPGKATFGYIDAKNKDIPIAAGTSLPDSFDPPLKYWGLGIEGPSSRNPTISKSVYWFQNIQIS